MKVNKSYKREKQKYHMKEDTSEEAAVFLGMDKGTVRKGLQQGVFPWGYAIKTSENRWAYFINANRFAEIEGISV